MSSDKHLSRKRLIEIARTEDERSDPHLLDCAHCRTAFAVLRKYHRLAGRNALPTPPAHLVRTAKALMRPDGPIGRRLVELAARLVFDSWAAPVPVGVRGPAVDDARRLHFEAADLTLELRAEQKQSGWSFVAQGSGLPDQFVLESDADIVRPDSLGVCQWRASKPPARVALHLPDALIVMPKLKWNRTRRK